MATSEEALRREIDSLKADLTALRADLKDLGKDVSSAARAGAEAAKDRVKSAMHAAKEHGEDAAEKLTEQIEAKPLTSVAIAFGVGVLLGAIIKK